VTAALTPVATLPAEQASSATMLPAQQSADAGLSAPQAVTTEQAAASLSDTVVSAESSESTNSLLETQPEAAAAVTTLAAALTHKVGAGDTLYNIASRYRLSVPELQQLNQLDDSALIVTGQVLRLSAAAEAVQSRAKKSPVANSAEPAPASYQVADGESWFSISYKYNIKLDTLLKWNNMTADQPLSIGQTIYLRDPASPSL